MPFESPDSILGSPPTSEQGTDESCDPTGARWPTDQEKVSPFGVFFSLSEDPLRTVISGVTFTGERSENTMFGRAMGQIRECLQRKSLGVGQEALIPIPEGFVANGLKVERLQDGPLDNERYSVELTIDIGSKIRGTSLVTFQFEVFKYQITSNVVKLLCLTPAFVESLLRKANERKGTDTWGVLVFFGYGTETGRLYERDIIEGCMALEANVGRAAYNPEDSHKIEVLGLGETIDKLRFKVGHIFTVCRYFV